jgi:hypothetical protein
MGGDGGNGVMGESQDCVLWKESEDNVGDVLPPSSHFDPSFFTVNFCVLLEGGDAMSVS